LLLKRARVSGVSAETTVTVSGHETKPAAAAAAAAAGDADDVVDAECDPQPHGAAVTGHNAAAHKPSEHGRPASASPPQPGSLPLSVVADGPTRRAASRGALCVKLRGQARRSNVDRSKCRQYLDHIPLLSLPTFLTL